MKNSFRSRIGLTMMFSLVVLLSVFVTLLIIGGLVYISFRTGLIYRVPHRPPVPPVLALVLASLIAGTVVSLFISRIATRPIKSIIQAVNELAAGDFSVRMDFTRPEPAAQLSDSFNRMAEELGNTELLRTDFVNNFSHEFKTPIVSIKGFAEMLKYENLSEAERNEYLDIIIHESNRLSTLATNVLNLSKIEKQSALTETAPFNAGEQIRQTVILLQSRWERKGQEISIEGQDITVTGSGELLGQVWINLLDNAIKFSPEGSPIEVTMREREGMAEFRFWNDGAVIPPEKLDRIFDKFYQGDTSRATAGNGLGLTLAKRIAELHGGGIQAQSTEEQGTAFTVTLPLK